MTSKHNGSILAIKQEGRKLKVLCETALSEHGTVTFDAYSVIIHCEALILINENVKLLIITLVKTTAQSTWRVIVRVVLKVKFTALEARIVKLFLLSPNILSVCFEIFLHTQWRGHQNYPQR